MEKTDSYRILKTLSIRFKSGQTFFVQESVEISDLSDLSALSEDLNVIRLRRTILLKNLGKVEYRNGQLFLTQFLLINL